MVSFIMDSSSSFTYYVYNLSLYDMNASTACAVLQSVNQYTAMCDLGLTYEEAAAVMSISVTSNTVNLGKDQMKNFFYTYIMIFALYMVILLYGQMVATNVASEKASRAMELLITSAKPMAMMFGKVLASCLAGLTQLICIFGTTILCYQFNKDSLGSNEIVASIFNIPASLLVYMLVFFVLGFLVYAFLYGAIGSTATKLEDINTSAMPITFLFIFGFMVVIFSMTGDNVDSVLMKICSYIPFTSPMAMFTRIAMSVVPTYEIVISISVLALSVVAIGYISAKIYRVGVLLYGTTPKLSSILKTVWKA